MADADSSGGNAPRTPYVRSNEAHRLACKKYERTNKRGFLMRAYRNMQSRVEGIQYRKFHLYFGKQLIDRDTFYEWSLASQDFHTLFDVWVASGNERRICPSVDRVDSDRGYTLDNMRWVPFTVNCKNIKRKKKQLAEQLELLAA